MAQPILSDPVNRWTIQTRLNATDAQWDKLEPHLARFEGPGGLVVFDWLAVIDTVRCLAQVKRPLIDLPSRRKPARTQRVTP